MAATARRLLSGSALRTVSLVATAVVSILIMPLVVHTLGDRDYGIWTLVATLIGYYGILDLGMGNAVNRYLASGLGSGDLEECNRIFNTALRIYLLLAGVVLAVSIVIAALAPLFCKTQQDASLFWKLILILGLSVALAFPVKVYRGVLEAQLRYDRAAGLDLLSLALRTAFVLAALLNGYRLLAFAWATFLGNLPATLLFVYLAHREIPFLRIESRYWTRGTARRLFSYSVYGLIAGIADTLRFRLDNFVVAGFTGLVAVTHYSVAGKLSQTYMDLNLAAMGMFLAVFSRQEGEGNFERIRHTFLFATKISIGVSSFIGFGLLAWGQPFIIRWMGASYKDAYPCLVVLVLGLIPSLWQTPSIALLYGVSRHKFLALAALIEGVANLLLSIWLVKIYGIVGVALGTMIPLLISKIFVQPVYASHVAGVAFGVYLRCVGRALAAVAGSLLIPLVLTLKFASPDYKTLFILGILSTVAYAAGLWMFEFTPEERHTFRAAIWPRGAGKDRLVEAEARN